MTNALVGQFLHTEHLWPQRPAHGVQQVGQRHVKRAFVGGAAVYSSICSNRRPPKYQDQYPCYNYYRAHPDG